jgi:hypothetical protein
MTQSTLPCKRRDAAAASLDKPPPTSRDKRFHHT